MAKKVSGKSGRRSKQRDKKNRYKVQGHVTSEVRYFQRRKSFNEPKPVDESKRQFKKTQVQSDNVLNRKTKALLDHREKVENKKKIKEEEKGTKKMEIEEKKKTQNYEHRSQEAEKRALHLSEEPKNEHDIITLKQNQLQKTTLGLLERLKSRGGKKSDKKGVSESSENAADMKKKIRRILEQEQKQMKDLENELKIISKSEEKAANAGPMKSSKPKQSKEEKEAEEIEKQIKELEKKMLKDEKTKGLKRKIAKSRNTVTGRRSKAHLIQKLDEIDNEDEDDALEKGIESDDEDGFDFDEARKNLDADFETIAMEKKILAAKGEKASSLVHGDEESTKNSKKRDQRFGVNILDKKNLQLLEEQINQDERNAEDETMQPPDLRKTKVLLEQKNKTYQDRQKKKLAKFTDLLVKKYEAKQEGMIEKKKKMKGNRKNMQIEAEYTKDGKIIYKKLDSKKRKRAPEINEEFEDLLEDERMMGFSGAAPSEFLPRASAKPSEMDDLEKLVDDQEKQEKKKQALLYEFAKRRQQDLLKTRVSQNHRVKKRKIE